jgi:hypothetical protein
LRARGLLVATVSFSFGDAAMRVFVWYYIIICGLATASFNAAV